MPDPSVTARGAYRFEPPTNIMVHLTGATVAKRLAARQILLNELQLAGFGVFPEHGFVAVPGKFTEPWMVEFSLVWLDTTLVSNDCIGVSFVARLQYPFDGGTTANDAKEEATDHLTRLLTRLAAPGGPLEGKMKLGVPVIIP